MWNNGHDARSCNSVLNWKTVVWFLNLVATFWHALSSLSSICLSSLCTEVTSDLLWSTDGLHLCDKIITLWVNYITYVDESWEVVRCNAVQFDWAEKRMTNVWTSGASCWLFACYIAWLLLSISTKLLLYISGSQNSIWYLFQIEYFSIFGPVVLLHSILIWEDVRKFTLTLKCRVHGRILNLLRIVSLLLKLLLFAAEACKLLVQERGLLWADEILHQLPGIIILRECLKLQ